MNGYINDVLHERFPALQSGQAFLASVITPGCQYTDTFGMYNTPSECENQGVCNWANCDIIPVSDSTQKNICNASTILFDGFFFHHENFVPNTMSHFYFYFHHKLSSQNKYNESD